MHPKFSKFTDFLLKYIIFIIKFVNLNHYLIIIMLDDKFNTGAKTETIKKSHSLEYPEKYTGHCCRGGVSSINLLDKTKEQIKQFTGY